MRKIFRALLIFLAVYLVVGFIVTSVIYHFTNLSGGIPQAYADSGFWLTVLLWPLGVLALYYEVWPYI